MKCLFYALASAAPVVGLTACDDGKIHTTLAPQYPAGAEGSGADAVDLTLLDAVQRRVFSAGCVQCHGGSNHAAAGLYLTEGKAAENLIGVESAVIAGAERVRPGNHEASVLWQAVATDVSRNWAYDHSNLLTPETIYLVETWIDLEN